MAYPVNYEMPPISHENILHGHTAIPCPYCSVHPHSRVCSICNNSGWIETSPILNNCNKKSNSNVNFKNEKPKPTKKSKVDYLEIE